MAAPVKACQTTFPDFASRARTTPSAPPTNTRSPTAMGAVRATGDGSLKCQSSAGSVDGTVAFVEPVRRLFARYAGQSAAIDASAAVTVPGPFSIRTDSAAGLAPLDGASAISPEIDHEQLKQNQAPQCSSPPDVMTPSLQGGRIGESVKTFSVAGSSRYVPDPLAKMLSAFPVSRVHAF